MSIQDNTTALQQILDTVNSLPDGDDEINLQNKTVSPTTARQIITADSGYDGLDTVTVNAMTTATQATPTISVNTSGLITASSMQTAGYVSAGTKSATKQLTVQAAKTVTPSTSNQTAVASGRYTTGAVTVKGDSNLVASNIKSGVSIFGVSGTYEGSGSGSSSGAIESCDVRLKWNGGSGIVLPVNSFYSWTMVKNGNIEVGIKGAMTPTYFTSEVISCLKNTVVTVSPAQSTPIVAVSLTDGYTIEKFYGSSLSGFTGIAVLVNGDGEINMKF